MLERAKKFSQEPDVERSCYTEGANDVLNSLLDLLADRWKMGEETISLNLLRLWTKEVRDRELMKVLQGLAPLDAQGNPR